MSSTTGLHYRTLETLIRGCLAWLLWMLALCSATPATTNLSAWVYPGSSGRLVRQPDAWGNRVLDYTAAGYRGGAVPIPDVPMRAAVQPGVGDDGAAIQAAINQVSALPLDANGFRGAVVLASGEYQVSNDITINVSGVVLRGAGSGTNGTILRATGAGQRSLIRIAGSGSPSTVSGTTRSITNNHVPAGAASFLVDSTAGFAAGDRVLVRRNANQQWINDLGMNLLENPWSPSSYIIEADRIITHVEGSRIFINAPVTCAIEQRYGGGTIRKYTWAGRIQNVGVENIRGVSDFAMIDDEDHGWILVQVNSAEHVWVRNVTSQYFGYACVALYGGTRFATVADCSSLDPVSIITGGRRYAFVLDDCQLCLVKNCYTDEDRHQFVTQSLTTGPNVFVDGLSDTAKSDAAPHHRWGTGALWDNVTVNGHAINVQNRGNSGSGHGWAGANEVVYNSYASGGYVVQNPPGARNWLIGSIGQIKDGTAYVGPHDPGTYDSSGLAATNVFPNSLYYAQLQDRLAAANLQTREYWLGEINGFTNGVAPGEPVQVDSIWRTSVQSAAGGAAVNGFDVVTGGQWIPFTFSFSLATNEQVIAATLSISLRSAGNAGGDDVLYVDSLTNAFPLAALGWTPVSTGTNQSVRTLDLTHQLHRLADGKLNLALQNDIGVDWALLELSVAPVIAGGTRMLPATADATIRAGASANANFGTASTLTVKEDSGSDNDRRALLRWNLTGITGAVHHARVRLMPVAVGLAGVEHGAGLVNDTGWTEGGITWNNQPPAGKRFATWIPSAGQPVEFIVTPQVAAALAGSRELSIEVFAIRNFGGASLIDYASDEHPDVNLRPQLLLIMSGEGDVTWNGVGAGLHAWSSGSNWLPDEPPFPAQHVKFFDPGAGGVEASNVNNVVDAAFQGTAASVHYGNTNGHHTTFIGEETELRIAGGGLIAGTETDNGTAQTLNATITGSGRLVMTGSNLVVRQASEAAGSQRATLNLSGLSGFEANVSRILVGSEGPLPRPTGTLLLAQTNRITAFGSAPAIAVAGAGGGSGNAGGASHLVLGRDNSLFADTIAVGRVKQGMSGGQASSLRFNPALTNAIPNAGPVVMIRAADGSGRVNSWTIADAGSQGGTVHTAGICDFTGGRVDALVNTMIVARSSTGSGAGFPTGSFILHDGILDVNTVQAGVQGSATANGGTNSAFGTVTVNGGLLRVNGVLQLGPTSGGAGAATNRGVLNVNRGSAHVNQITAGSGAGNALTISDGTLVLSNNAGPGIGRLALTNAALVLRLNSDAAAIAATNVAAGGSSNVIHFISVPELSPPLQIPVIRYSGMSGSFNFQLGALPTKLRGFLTNNAAAGSIDAVLMEKSAPVIRARVDGGDLVLSGAGGFASGGFVLLATTNLAQPLSNWMRMATNVFNPDGTFSVTNQVDFQPGGRFYLLEVL